MEVKNITRTDGIYSFNNVDTLNNIISVSGGSVDASGVLIGDYFFALGKNEEMVNTINELKDIISKIANIIATTPSSTGSPLDPSITVDLSSFEANIDNIKDNLK